MTKKGLVDRESFSLRDVIRLGESRGLDFIKEEDLSRRTGIEALDVVAFTISELLANALDKKDATKINIEVQRDAQFDYVTMSDNGPKKLDEAALNMIFDFDHPASSKRGLLLIQRGMLGNALRSDFGFSYRLSEKKGLTQPQIVVSSGRFQYKTRLKPDRINQRIDHEPIEITERVDDGFTAVTVGFPIERTVEDLKGSLLVLIKATSMVNSHRLISYSVYGEKGNLGTMQETETKELETVVNWYTLKQFVELAEDYVRARPEVQVKDFMGVFKWFARKSAVSNILFEVNSRNVHPENGKSLQIVLATSLKDLSSQDLKLLFDVMKSQSKPISKRSAPCMLGLVGEDNFERIRQEHGWPQMRRPEKQYVYLVGMNRSCPEHYCSEQAYRIPVPCRNLDHVTYPYIVELAILDRNDTEGPQVFQCVNFMSSTHDLFHSMFDVTQRLARVGITEKSSVTIIVHVISPILPWTNYGKSSVGNIDSEGLLERAFDKLLPIPKTPRVYQPPPPARPLSWVPKGNFYDEIYRQRLKLFADEIKAIVRISAFHVMPKMRGWGYRCEQLGKIDKGEFNSLARAINDCRKLKLLKMDIIRADPDESRHFRGIHRAGNPKTLLEQLRSDVKEILASLPSNVTDFYKDEKFYLIVVVEKSEIFDVFGPICEDYHIPHVSSKGWSNLEIRANIAEQCNWAVAHGLKPVLLLFYDHDPKGLKISERFRRHLKDMEKATGWNPDTMEVMRFGLNKDQIDKYELSWVPNLKTSKGKEAKRTRDVLAYIRQFGERKCEMESLFKDDRTLRDAEQICREAIEHYLGKDAVERFRKKEEQSKAKLGTVYDSPLLKQFDDELTRIEQTFPEELKTEPVITSLQEQEIEIFVDDKYYGKCPRCGKQFNYDVKKDVGKLLLCRDCSLQMRIRLA